MAVYVAGLDVVMGAGMGSLVLKAVVVDAIMGASMHSLVPSYAVRSGALVNSGALTLSYGRSYCRYARNTAESAGKQGGVEAYCGWCGISSEALSEYSRPTVRSIEGRLYLEVRGA